MHKQTFIFTPKTHSTLQDLQDTMYKKTHTNKESEKINRRYTIC